MPPKPAKDQTKSTPTNKSANEKDTIKGLKKLVDSLEKEKGTWEKKLKEKDKEIERLVVVQGFCGEGDNVPTTPITNSRDLRSAPAANGTTGEGNIQDHSKEIKRLTEENKELKEELNESLFEDETSKTAAQIPVSDSETLMKDLLERNKRLIVENSELKEQIKKSNSPKSTASRDLKDAEAQVKQLKEKNEKLMEEKIKAVREVDNLKNRAFGSKIYRPVELVEKFSEVYDIEWTDALEELLEKINNEKAVMQILLHIVMDAYQFCTEKAETFYGSLKGAVSQTFKTMTLTDPQRKLINDYRMATAEHLVTNLQEEFCRANKFDEGNVTHYQNACIRVCWLLAVQDPPVFMDVKENATGAKFDSDKYKCFTKKGNVVDYIIWPVLYLQKGGPLLSKGTAQPK